MFGKNMKFEYNILGKMSQLLLPTNPLPGCITIYFSNTFELYKWAFRKLCTFQNCPPLEIHQGSDNDYEEGLIKGEKVGTANNCARLVLFGNGSVLQVLFNRSSAERGRPTTARSGRDDDVVIFRAPPPPLMRFLYKRRPPSLLILKQSFLRPKKQNTCFDSGKTKKHKGVRQ